MENTMNIDEFAKALKDKLFEINPDMADTHTVNINEVTKNNGTVLHGLTIQEEGGNIAPTIYVDQAFDSYKNGESIDVLANGILNTYEEHKPPQSISVDFFTDFDQAKERLTMKVINAEKNAEMLDGMPHFAFGDLAAIFQVQVESNEFGNAVITVKDEHMDMWGVDVSTLMEYAKANMEEKQPIRIQSMMEVLAEMMGTTPEEMMNMEQPPMYVMSNESKVNGAAAMVFTDKIDEFAQQHDANIFILPSSVHEILLLVDNGEMDVANLESMVREVNATQVAPEEVLSDNVYFYDKDEKMLYVAETKEPCVLKASEKKDPAKDSVKKAEKKPEAKDAGSIKDKLTEGKDKSAALPKMEDKKPTKGQELA